MCKTIYCRMRLEFKIIYLGGYFYYTATETSNDYGAVWRLTLSTGESTWVITETVHSLQVFLKVNTNRFFLAGMGSIPAGNEKHVFAVFEWGNPTFIWQNLRENKPDQLSSRLQMAEAVLSHDGKKIYSISGQDR